MLVDPVQLSRPQRTPTLQFAAQTDVFLVDQSYLFEAYRSSEGAIMQTSDTRALTGPTDWSGPTYSGFGNASVKLRWIKDAYKWHTNDGPEVFLVLDGTVDMHVRSGDGQSVMRRLSAGEMIFIDEGEEHIACPSGAARILVVERAEQAVEASLECGAEH
jgi:mannose-6-phosphate isomerase-like protein (cupin superfamily)